MLLGRDFFTAQLLGAGLYVTSMENFSERLVTINDIMLDT